MTPHDGGPRPHDNQSDGDTSTDGALPRFLTLEEVAELLRVEVETVLELVEAYDLPAFLVGDAGPWRVERDVLERYIDDRYEAQRRVARLGLPEGDDFAELWGPHIPEDG